MTIATHYFPHYTIADYEQWQGDWELWAGYPVAMTPSPSFDHQQALSNLLFAIKTSLQNINTCHCQAVVEVDWRIAEDTVVRPDVMVVCEPIKTKWVEITPSLIAEVLSPSTRNNDLTFKKSLYAEQGVTYSLIVDPTEEQSETLHWADGQYEPAESTPLTLHEGCALSLDLSAIWA